MAYSDNSPYRESYALYADRPGLLELPWQHGRDPGVHWNIETYLVNTPTTQHPEGPSLRFAGILLAVSCRYPMYPRSSKLRRQA